MMQNNNYLEKEAAEYFADIFSAPTGYPISDQPIDVSAYEDLNVNEMTYDPREDLDYNEFMNSLVDPVTGTLRDFRVDDRSLPAAVNFYDYCLNINKGELNIPWARQLIAVESFLGEICPYCSNKKYLDPLEVPKDFPPEDLKNPKRLVLLENGVCPICGRTKKQIYRENTFPRYTQGVFVWGQRCVSGNTWILTDTGLYTIKSLIAFKKPYLLSKRGYAPFSQVIHNGHKLQKTANAFMTKLEERLIRIELSNGCRIDCTCDHPLMTKQNGWQTAGELLKAFNNGQVNSLEQCLGTHIYTQHPISRTLIGNVLSCHYDSVKQFVIDLIKNNNQYVCEDELTLQGLYSSLINAGLSACINYATKTVSVEQKDFEQLKKHSVDDLFLDVDFPRRVEYIDIANIYFKDYEEFAFDFTVPETHSFVANGLLNHNSGKSSTAASIASYTLHRYLKYPMLAELAPRMMQKSTQLTGIFCSLTFKKAVDVLWIPFRNIILTSEWFNTYFELLEDYKRKTGVKLLINSTTKLAIGNKNMLCFPTGPRASTLRGNTSFMCYLDELGLFPIPKKEEDDDVNRQASPDEAYTSLFNSLVTVTSTSDALVDKGYYSVPPSFILSVSSPVSSRDKVMRLLKDAEKDPSIFTSHLPSWEVNPGLWRNKGMIASAFIKDPEKAMRDYGAQPSDIAFGYFNFEDCVKLFTGNPLTHTFKQRVIDDELFCTITKVSSVPYPCVMALDAGLVNNSFSVVVIYYDTQQDKIKTAAIVECMPVKGKTINFAKMYEHVILPLAKDLNVCYVCADRWNSIDLLHRLKHDMGNNPKGKPFTRADTYTLKKKDFEAFKLAIANQSLILPKLRENEIEEIRQGITGDYRKAMYGRPVNHLLLQMATVIDAGVNLCPEKGPGFTDDILRAYVLAVTRLQTEKVSQRLIEFKDYIKTSDPNQAMYVPIVVGRMGLG